MVSFAGSDRELSRQVRVELALIDDGGVHELGLFAQTRVRCWLFLNGRLRGLSYVLAPLARMTNGGGRRQF
jgi:hypothetical protein